jgi:hypothetical protein
METITLRAHFDGQQILLDEPYELQPNTRLLITVLYLPDGEREKWLKLSAQGLNMAYGQDEPEYTLALVKEPNPSYQA